MPYCAQCGNPVAVISFAPCPSCGRATNGSPRTMGGGDQGTKAVLIIGGVLVGALVLVAIAGILAAIAIPNFLTAMQRSRQKRTMADIRTIAVTVESHRASNESYPETLDGLGNLPRQDGWANAIKYERTGSGYAIASAGKDGLFDHDDLDQYTERATSDFDDDIVFANGKFVQYPEGVQQ